MRLHFLIYSVANQKTAFIHGDKHHGFLRMFYKYYISCKIDFSDLQEKVDYIRNNWEQLKEMRISAREYLFSFYDIKKQALDFKDILDRCCSRIKKM